ncbi:hypothetical protein BGZ95_008688 [Linnemannia exigua]|uniref:40S ribosomal protein S12 n=1 Tax=Linnemannia exigua TaxID=604196 RepID=A0AAD4DKS8_9FUNG|nr:hypothetical protein BGZ95_008688 [Linnemannia exigua]
MSDAHVEVEVAADTTARGQMSVEEALQDVLKRALVHDGLARGLRECAKALDRRQAHMAVLVETCTEKEYIKLVEALCAEHNINLIKVSDAKKLGEWYGLCKIDREGEYPTPKNINKEDFKREASLLFFPLLPPFYHPEPWNYYETRSLWIYILSEL